MSKKGGGGGDFNNRAARRFKQPDKVDLMPQEEIFEIFDEDITLILEQVTKNRNHQGKWPQYISNAFANLSTPLWFKMYIEEHVRIKKKKHKMKTDLSEEEISSLKQILADAYKRSATNQFPQQTQEFKERNELLSKAFIMLDPLVYHQTKKLGLSKAQRRELVIQIYGDPVNNMRFVHKIFNHSNLSDKKKLKLMKKMYGKKRFLDAVGAAMTVDSNNSDCIAMLYDYMMDLKLKKRAPILIAYAKAYKKNKSNNFRLTGGEFYGENKKLIKELKRRDIGFKKAFKSLKPKAKDTAPVKTKSFKNNR